MDALEDPDKWFVRLNDLLGQLLALGQRYDDDWLVVFILSKLPSNYDTLRVLLQGEDGLTFESAKRKIREAYKNNVMRTEAKEADAAKALAVHHVSGDLP
eukprot:35386-Eustigmatos_ZCMA.PRE.1